MRDLADRYGRVVRLGLALTCLGVALTPWLYDPTNTERVHSALSFLAAALLFASVVGNLVARRLLDVALTLATLVLLYTGFLVAFDGVEQVVQGADAWFVGLLAGGAGVIAAAQMMRLVVDDDRDEDVEREPS